MQSVSTGLDGALWANRVSYFGSVLLPLCMMMIIMNVCKVNYQKWCIVMLTVISAIVFLIAASGGYSTLYYADVDVVFIDGAAKLVKEYGPLHNLYYIYLFGYMAAMAAVIIYSLGKRRNLHQKHALLLLCVVFGNIVVWFVEQLISMEFEFLSISYVVTELFMLGLYCILQEYGLTDGELGVYRQEVLTEGILIERYPLMAHLTDREWEVVWLILQGEKRKEIAERLNVTEHTIKKHTSHIFAKLEIGSREEMYRKLGIKRN
jgi:DNA-binding CsgD family transcriptional regulator